MEIGMKSREDLRKVVASTEEASPNPNATAVCRAAILLLVSFAFGLAAPSRGYAAVRAVCASSCKYTTIAAAIAAAKAGDVIFILDAVRSEANITVDRNLTIQGQGAGKTAVDGAADGTVFTVASGVTATFRNLTIRNGFSMLSGGGLNNAGTVTISNCTLSGNSSDGLAGGLYNAGTLTISNSKLAANGAFEAGGLYNDGGTVTIGNSTLSGNDAFDEGGLYNAGTLIISNSTLSGNDGFEAGGLYNDGGTATINSSTLSDNSSTRLGGAIRNDGGAVTIVDSALSGNSAMFSGGAIFNNTGATLSISNSTLSGNLGNGTPTSEGGAIINSGTITVSSARWRTTSLLPVVAASGTSAAPPSRTPLSGTIRVAIVLGL
jgi:hypothetical protein